ncbi:hypothetical protein [Terrabacter sp. NPDC000476]|uniref:hypothetical protein n=1 Tax=Terrabacter sp. NPDC000476 TaxID=3154258 RepID=UPI0033213075
MFPLNASSPPVPQARRSRRGAAVVGVTLAALVGLVAGGSVPAGALEKVTSGASYGDFETVGLTPQGWSVSAPSPNRGVVSSSRSISGARSLLVEDTSTSRGAVVARRLAVRPGANYHAQGYAYTTRGAQTLSLTFADAAGRVIARHSTPSTGAAMVWSRVEVHAKAPAAARSVVVQVSSSNAAVSTLWWDSISVISPAVVNAGFESVPTATAPVPGWSRFASGGATAGVTTSQSRLGSRSLHLADRTTAGFALVRSAKVRVFPAVSHDVRAWVRPTAGALTETVRWYDSAQRLVRSQGYSVSGRLNAWNLVSRRLTAPQNAHYATVEFGTTRAGTGTADWDAVSVLPAAGAKVRTYPTGVLSQPLDGFSNTNVTAATVVGGRAKLFTIVAGMPAELQMIDVQSGSVEVRRALPGVTSGWALTTGSDGSLYAAGSGGHLFRYLPASKTLRDLGRVTSRATTVWDLERGADGRIWGVSYPGSELWSYNPSTNRVTSLGSVSTAHAYARSLAVSGSYAYVGVGSTYPAVIRVSLSTGAKTRIGLPVPVTAGTVSDVELLGRYLLVRTPAGTNASGGRYAGERRLYDTRTGSWNVAANMPAQTPSSLDPSGRFYYFSYKQLWAVNSATGAKAAVASTTMNPGRDRHVVTATLGGVSGRWLLAYDPAGVVRAINLSTHRTGLYSVKFRSTKMRLKTLEEGARGAVYAGGFGGPSLAVMSPTTGTGPQYPARSGVRNSIGEVEGTKAHGSFEYIGTYTGGNVFRYDTTKPWVDGSNPRLVASLGTSHKQDRPLAWATAGSRTFFGTVPKYGVRGGVLGYFTSDSSAATIVPQPVAGHSVVSLAASGNVVYGGTSRWGGLGAAPAGGAARVFAYDASSRRKLWESTPISGAQSIGALTMGPNGSLWAASGPLLVELDRRTGAVVRRVMVYPAPATSGAVYRNADLVYADGVFYLAAMDRVYVVDPATLRVTAAVPSGMSTQRLAVTGSRVLYPAGTSVRYFNR